MAGAKLLGHLKLETTRLYTEVAVVSVGWLVIDLPPFEAWESQLRWLTQCQRERVESTEFFELLRRELTQRFEPVCGGGR